MHANDEETNFNGEDVELDHQCTVLEEMRKGIASLLQPVRFDDFLRQEALTKLMGVENNPGSYMETAFLKAKYVRMVLGHWLETSLKWCAQRFDSFSSSDLAKLSPEKEEQLNNIECLMDVKHLITNWAPERDNAKQNLLMCDLILDQSELFDKKFVSITVRQFKLGCITYLLTKIGCQQSISFIPDLIDMLTAINLDRDRDAILMTEEPLNAYINGSLGGKDYLTKLHENYTRNKNQIGEKAAIEHFFGQQREIIATMTPKLEMLMKRTCFKILMPAPTVEMIDEMGRQVILVKGTAIMCSKVMEEINRLKQNPNEQVEELRFICYSALHVDCDLNRDVWHGTNITIVTDKLLVHGELRCWDVSGEDNTFIYSPVDDSGAEPGQDAKAG